MIVEAFFGDPRFDLGEIDRLYDVQIEILTITTTVAQIIPPDSGRVAFAIVQRGGQDFFFSPQNFLITGDAIPMSSVPNPFELFYADWGPLVKREWFARTAMGESNPMLWQLCLRPGR